VLKKCAGIKFTESCNSTIQCNAGYFCNSTKTCDTQRGADGDCGDYLDCKNEFACYNKKCTPWASKKVGDDVSNSTIGDLAYTGAAALVCESGYASHNDTTFMAKSCAYTNYTGDTATKADKNGIVKCDYGYDCYYTDGVATTSQKCQCGYNSAGQGYCPIATTYLQTEYTNALKATSALFKNECHSQSRFGCYKINQQDKSVTDLVVHKHNTLEKHLFIDAVECAYDVLASSYINMSVALIAVVIAFIF